MFGCQNKYVSQQPYPKQADKKRDTRLSKTNKSSLLNHTDTEADYGVGINMKCLVSHSQDGSISGKQYRKL